MKSKIPSLLAIFILVAAIGGFIFGLKGIQSFTSSAKESFVPIDVKITNIGADSLTVSWLTNTPSIGFVKYSNNGGNSQTAPTSMSLTHLITIQNLTPSTRYSLVINSSGVDFNNSGSPWQSGTLDRTIPEEGAVVSGNVLDKNNLPAKNAIIYITAEGKVFSTKVSLSGNWIVTIPDTGDSTKLSILVEEKPNSKAEAKINLKEANPVPTIKLGNSYDFTNENSQKPETAPVDLPLVPIELP